MSAKKVNENDISIKYFWQTYVTYELSPVDVEDIMANTHEFLMLLNAWNENKEEKGSEND